MLEEYVLRRVEGGQDDHVGQAAFCEVCTPCRRFNATIYLRSMITDQPAPYDVDINVDDTEDLAFGLDLPTNTSDNETEEIVNETEQIVVELPENYFPFMLTTMKLVSLMKI